MDVIIKEFGLKSKSTCKTAKSDTGHEIHGHTAKANRNPSALAEQALASAGPAWARGAMGAEA